MNKLFLISFILSVVTSAILIFLRKNFNVNNPPNIIRQNFKLKFSNESIAHATQQLDSFIDKWIFNLRTIFDQLKYPFVKIGRLMNTLITKTYKLTGNGIQQKKKTLSLTLNNNGYLANMSIYTAQLKLIEEVFNSSVLKNETLLKIAESTHVNLDHYLIYRYFAAVDWAPNYHGKAIQDAIVDTINWRYDYGINKIDTNEILPLLDSGIAYTTSKQDKDGRAVLFVKPGRILENKKDSTENFLKMIMFTVERY